jgi:hypothetical protein
VLPEVALRVLEEVGDSARPEPSHPRPSIVGLRAEDHPATALCRTARSHAVGIPPRPPAQDVGLGGGRTPELHTVPVPAGYLVRAVESGRRRAHAILPGRNVPEALGRRDLRLLRGSRARTQRRGSPRPRDPSRRDRPAAQCSRARCAPGAGSTPRSRPRRSPGRPRGGARDRHRPIRGRSGTSPRGRRRRTACATRRSPSRRRAKGPQAERSAGRPLKAITDIDSTA